MAGAHAPFPPLPSCRPGSCVSLWESEEGNIAPVSRNVPLSCLDLDSQGPLLSFNSFYQQALPNLPISISPPQLGSLSSSGLLQTSMSDLNKLVVNLNVKLNFSRSWIFLCPANKLKTFVEGPDS